MKLLTVFLVPIVIETFIWVVQIFEHVSRLFVPVPSL
jgi:hypothetical protein